MVALEDPWSFVLVLRVLAPLELPESEPSGGSVIVKVSDILFDTKLRPTEPMVFVLDPVLEELPDLELEPAEPEELAVIEVLVNPPTAGPKV